MFTKIARYDRICLTPHWGIISMRDGVMNAEKELTVSRRKALRLNSRPPVTSPAGTPVQVVAGFWSQEKLFPSTAFTTWKKQKERTIFKHCCVRDTAVSIKMVCLRAKLNDGSYLSS